MSSDIFLPAQDLMRAEDVVPPVSMMPAGDLDATLCRYLRARKWDVRKACDMLQGAESLPDLVRNIFWDLEGRCAVCL